MNRALYGVMAVLMLAHLAAGQQKKKAPANPVPDAVVQRYEARSIEHGGVTIQYRVIKPGKMDKGVKYPLVISLHGSGERGSDNREQLKFLPTWLSEPAMRTQYPCFLVAPQCPSEGRWSGPPLEAVIALTEKAIAEWPVDAGRVYLTGLSMGGYGSWEFASKKPELLAAAAPICGGGDPSKAATLAKLPLWVVHGDADKAVNVNKSREMVEAIKKAGGNIQYTELPGGGHQDAWNHAYNKPGAVVQWLFKQKKP